ncbi:proliferation-associated protein 2G4 [Pocillopora verrucosa]|uniref:proliferation-associated protein 2G4-like n=1 Tax=Pocillopora damicornis TaxID=46731 RepID=UPI000F54FD6F|nr:proliferation-associated protein 2G4-like [Pocillopora damicornis]XP_058962556.1 proliferation-associated protein 2G4-like [Pocillopora verrucosa]
MADKGSDSGEEEDPTIAEDVVVTKYKMAGDMANRILKKIIDATTVGTTARTLCQMGDNLIEEETSKVFKKEKELKKGIAFPTCISVNHVVCHFSPLLSETDIPINDGDMVKIDLGVHIDGYIAVVGHTIVVGASKDNKITGAKADVLLAAHLASEVAQRLVKAGNENYTVTDQIQKVAEAFQCKPVEGMLSHQLKRNIIDGEKAIIQNPNEQQRKDHAKCEFAVHDVFAVDILISTGDGKTKEKDTRTTVYKRTENNYQLKMKASRAFYSEVCNKFTTMPFTLRAFEDEKKAKMGVVECCKHQLLEPFNVLWEKEGEYVAQFKFTLLIMPNGPIRITQGPFDPEVIQSEYSIKDQEIKDILATSASRKTQKKKKKKASTKASDAVVAETKNGGDAGD